ncbi:MAG: hypothetical protein KDB61_00220 [Planctomycetes bacterium]|nr:hypothetical protein [Planctomycetota bacterium]
MSYFIHDVTNTMLDNFDAEVTAPATWYVGLFTTIPGRNGTGGVEVSKVEYARQSVVFGAAVNSIKANTTSVRFPTPVTTGGYGTIVAMGLFLDSDPGVAPTPRAVLVPPGGSFTMPVGYDRELPAGYISLEFKE